MVCKRLNRLGLKRLDSVWEVDALALLTGFRQRLGRVEPQAFLHGRCIHLELARPCIFAELQRLAGQIQGQPPALFGLAAFALLKRPRAAFVAAFDLGFGVHETLELKESLQRKSPRPSKYQPLPNRLMLSHDGDVL